MLRQRLQKDRIILEAGSGFYKRGETNEVPLDLFRIKEQISQIMDQLSVEAEHATNSKSAREIKRARRDLNKARGRIGSALSA